MSLNTCSEYTCTCTFPLSDLPDFILGVERGVDTGVEETRA